MPLLYDPAWPLASFVAALAALPLALLVRRLGGATRARPLPRGWRSDHIVLFSALLTGAYVGVALLASVLEPLVGQLRAGVQAEPVAAVAASLGQLMAQLAWAAWQGLMLTLPVGAALAGVAELRWPRGPLRAMAQVAAWPLVGGSALWLLPPDASGLRICALVLTPVATYGLARALVLAPSRWARWRAQEAAPVTRVSSLPAAMAQALGATPAWARQATIATPLPETEAALPPTEAIQMPAMGRTVLIRSGSGSGSGPTDLA